MGFQVKRIYDDADPADGRRILVDRLWPRGVGKQRAALDRWLKEIAPSDELRRAYHQDELTWEQFRARYLAELEEHEPLLAELAAAGASETVTLLYAVKDPERNHALLLKEMLDRRG